MADEQSDSAFTGPIADMYDRLMVPMLFAPYAVDLAEHLATSAGELLEVAAGTGVLTRELADRLPAGVTITATDLNQPMLDRAAMVGTSRHVDWHQADVDDLPFPDAAFDTVVCQFGVMFFPDRARAFTEIHRVLRPGGSFHFNTWDRIGHNDFARLVTDAVGAMFPADPPSFLIRTPHGYFDDGEIRRDLINGGFADDARIDRLVKVSRADSAMTAASAYCLGSPLSAEILARDPLSLEAATERAAAAIQADCGVTGVSTSQVAGKMSAFDVSIDRRS